LGFCACQSISTDPAYRAGMPSRRSMVVDELNIAFRFPDASLRDTPGTHGPLPIMPAQTRGTRHI